MNSKNSSKKITNPPSATAIAKRQEQIRNAKHGEFFFAHFTTANHEHREGPVFVISSDDDKEDVVVCSCTKQPARTEFDVLVNLKLPTNVRTNKIYTIQRTQLAFKIPQTATTPEYQQIMEKIKKAISIT